jgi:hypothetical protein
MQHVPVDQTMNHTILELRVDASTFGPYMTG